MPRIDKYPLWDIWELKMPDLLLVVTAVFLVLFLIGPILLVSIFIGRITKKGKEPPFWTRHRHMDAMKP